MRATYNTTILGAAPRTILVWVLCLLATAIAAPAPAPLDIDININLGDALAGLTTRPLCDQYSFIANYSAIGANSTMRDALQSASPHGADIVGRVVDAAMKAAGYFARDKTINKMCGNLTSIADQEAANNFSNGIVADQVVGGQGLGAGARAGASLGLAASLALLVLAAI
ncbi:hypothetical protein PG985_000193 [Apiospora marii]|uniref:Uncharacterized protein n=1 Tax=Apiospora marii TaxID=335849 RepID=A0ABR1R253_9PEZI